MCFLGSLRVTYTIISEFPDTVCKVGVYVHYWPFSENTETKQDPAKPSWAQKPLCVPCFLFIEKRLLSPRPSPGYKEQAQAVND